jgi:hypothetical protein
MKYIIALVLTTQLITSTLEAQPFKSASDSLAYSLGVLVGNNLKNGGFSDINMEIFQKGLSSA